MSDLYGDSSNGQGMINLDQSQGKNRILVFIREVFKMLNLPVTGCYSEALETIIDPLPATGSFGPSCWGHAG